MADNNNQLDLVIVASRFNSEICGSLVTGAQRYLSEQGLQAELIRVQGAFELPVVCRNLASSGASGIIALGCVIKGDTDHFEFVCRGCTDGLMRVMLDYGVPIGFGVLMTDNLQQAIARSSKEHMMAATNHAQEEAVSNKGYEAAQALVETLTSLSGVQSSE